MGIPQSVHVEGHCSGAGDAMNIQEIVKSGWWQQEAVGHLAGHVEKVLLATAFPIGTTKLITTLLPNATSDEYKKLTSVLWSLRQRPDTRDFWAYSGKKTMYGKQAIHWLPLTKSNAMAKRDAEIASWSKEEF